LNWQVDEHSCDLWCNFFSAHFLNELVDELSHLVLVLRIIRDNCIHEHGSFLVVFNDVRGSLLSWLLIKHWWLSHCHVLINWHSHCWLLELVWHRAILLRKRLCWHHLRLLLAIVLLSAHLVVVVIWSVVGSSVVHFLVHVLSVEVSEQSLNQLEHLWLVDQVHADVCWVLFLVVLEISLVLDILLLSLS
jgi:hypothetical protein